ncbi:MAG TPA: DUF4294 domain-containing protein [Flavipsychrobacter sp.]|jgi:hypothetical protein|nr:DUF4294 domain-containing protein [Flavipsychrobacter sp.]
MLLLLSFRSAAQQKSATDTILLGAVIENGDTIANIFLDDFEVLDRLPKKWARKQTQFNRLRYNVYKTYPYAVIAAGVLKDVNEKLAMIPEEKAKKAYMKSIEKELKAKFKGDLENLTISQGQVLVKLINRQTGRNCYSIIKEVKGGFNAVVYQSVALLFSNNLKKAYDPEGDDRDIESVVREIEAANYYRYQYYRQQQMQARRN